jgi:hypothetical protein
VFDANLKTYLNTSGPITDVEKQKMAGGGAAGSSSASLGIGSLKGTR